MAKNKSKQRAAQILVRLPLEQRERLNKVAASMSLSVNNLLVQFIERWLVNKEAELARNSQSEKPLGEERGDSSE
jgi:predicted DNA-binding protein